jgi:hypothetical protein
MSSEAVITDASAPGSELETLVGETLALGRERPYAAQPQDEADVIPLRTGTPFLNAYCTGEEEATSRRRPNSPSSSRSWRIRSSMVCCPRSPGTSLMSFDGGVTRFAAVGPPRTGSGYSDGMVG